MKKLSSSLFLLSLFLITFAQLPPNALAADFTMIDLNGNSHNLYAYLDQGKTVYIDFFASYCPYCWAYHNTHHLKNLYEQHGPNGTLSDDVVVLAIEIYTPSTDDHIKGMGGNSQGDWTAGTPYPIFNPSGQALVDIKSLYQVSFYPMIYAICPDRTTTFIDTVSAEALYAHVGTCGSVSVMEAAFADNLGVYPNPVKDDFMLEISDLKADTDLWIYNSMGEKVFFMPLHAAKTSVSLSDLADGVYYLLLSDGRRAVVQKQ